MNDQQTTPYQPYGYAQQPYDYGQSAVGYGYPTPPPRKGGNGVLIAVLIGTMVIGAAVFVAPFLFLNKVMSDASDLTSSLDGSQTQQILDNDLDVTIGDYKKPESDYGLGHLSVTLKNKGDDRATFRVQIEAVNDSGERIADTYVSAEKLAAGQSASEDTIFAVSEDDKKAQLATAKFNIISVTKSDF